MAILISSLLVKDSSEMAKLFVDFLSDAPQIHYVEIS